MSANFYELLKYAATGQASPSMTYYDKMRASTLMGGVVKTLTGQPPLTFKADGTPLISWSMKGNGVQSGTPTPQNPVYVVGTGERTINLMPEPVAGTVSSAEIMIESDGNGHLYVHGTREGGTSPTISLKSAVTLNGTYYVHVRNNNSPVWSAVVLRNGNTSIADFGISAKNTIAEVTFNNATIDGLQMYVTSGKTIDTNMEISIESTGDTTAFEMYGFKIPISCAGQTTPLYLGEVPTVRRVKKLVLDGTETWGSEATNMYHISCDMPLLSYQDAISDRYSMQDGYAKIVNTDGAFGISRRPALFIHDNRYTSIANFKSYLAAQYAAGTPVTVWYVLADSQTGIVNEPLMKIGDYCDELTTTTPIPTAKGSNTLTVDTTVQPSEMTITYKG